MSAQQFSVVLLGLGAVALGAAGYFGTPWPGVALCGLSLAPWGWSEWARSRPAWKGTDLEKRLEEHGQQISSLRNAVSLRGTLGG